VLYHRADIDRQALAAMLPSQSDATYIEDNEDIRGSNSDLKTIKRLIPLLYATKCYQFDILV
jgi:hypothetical protein